MFLFAVNFADLLDHHETSFVVRLNECCAISQEKQQSRQWWWLTNLKLDNNNQHILLMNDHVRNTEGQSNISSQKDTFCSSGEFADLAIAQ